MKRNIRSTIKEVITFVTIGALMGFTWHSLYVKPHDKVRMELVECMKDNHDMSQSGYNNCIEMLRPR